MGNNIKITYAGLPQNFRQFEALLTSFSNSESIKVEFEDNQANVFAEAYESIINENQRKVEIFDDAKLKLLVENLNNSCFEVKEKAILDLAISRNPRARQPLLDLLTKERDLAVIRMICYALGELGKAYPKASPKVLKALVIHLNHANAPIRQASAKALGRLKTEDALTPLLERLKVEDDWAVMEAIAQAFAIIPIEIEVKDREAILKALKTLQQDENIFVRRAAFFAVYKLEQKH